MKGLSSIPQVGDLLTAYNKLQSQSKVDLSDVVLYSQWARLDPRLAEVLVAYLIKHWQELPMGALIEGLGAQPWPRAMNVFLRFVMLAIPRVQSTTLKHLVRAIDSRFPIDSYQLFFIPLQNPNPVVQRQEINWRIAPYLRSGFIGSQSLLSRSQSPSNRTVLKKIDRKKILMELLARQKTVNVHEYLHACRNLMSPRQAQRDLAELTGVRAKGFTRGRKYSLARALNKKIKE